jgi:hypothetical protein
VPSLEFHGWPGEQREGAAGPQSAAQVRCRIQVRVQVDGLAGGGVGGQHVQRDGAGEHRAEIHDPGVDLLDEGLDVQDGPSGAQQVDPPDQGAGQGGVVPDAQAGRVGAAQPGTGDGSGRGTVDVVEDPGEP